VTCVWVGVTSLLCGCRGLEWLDLTGCFHVSNASLQCAVTVIQDEVKVKDEVKDDGRVLTLFVGGTSVSDVGDIELPTRLIVDTSAPYDMWHAGACDVTRLY